MTDRELLKEARDALRGFHDWPDQNNLIHRIDSALADTGNTDAGQLPRCTTPDQVECHAMYNGFCMNGTRCTSKED